ncbi:hypothetical protein Tco_0944968 [Tanacetum coccineum]
MLKDYKDHPLKNIEDRGIFDSGCSGHIPGNKDHLDDFEECKGGSVTFGGSRISMLPNTEIFEGMGNMGYPADGTFTFWKSHFTPQWRFLVHHILHCMSPKSGGWDQFGSNLATALICLSTGRIYNFSKLIFDGMVANLKSKTKFLMYPRFLQMILEIQTEDKHPYLAIVLTKKIFGNMKRGFRGVPRPLLPAMLPVVAVDQSAGPADQAEDQPSSSAPLPSSSHPPVISATLASEPTPVAEPTTHHTSPSPEPDNEPTKHIFKQPSPEHQSLSPRQETEVPQSQDPWYEADITQKDEKIKPKTDKTEHGMEKTKSNRSQKLTRMCAREESFLEEEFAKTMGHEANTSLKKLSLKNERRFLKSWSNRLTLFVRYEHRSYKGIVERYGESSDRDSKKIED